MIEVASRGPGPRAAARTRALIVVRRDGLPPRLSWWAAAVVAAAGGALLNLSSPPLAWWPAAFLGVICILAGIWQQRIAAAALAGLIGGWVFWGPHVDWLTLYLGPIPWLGLTSLMSFWYLLFGIAAAVATRGLARIGALGQRPAALVAAQSATVAGLWIVREQLQGAVPYGGFPWGRIAHTQAEGPLLQSVSWLGFAGLGGVIVFACALPLAARWVRFGAGAAVGAGQNAISGSALDAVPTATAATAASALDAAPESSSASEPAEPDPDGPTRGPGRLLAVAAGAGLAILLVLALLPAAPLQHTGSLRVAAIQGNSKSGIFDDRENGSVLTDHVNETSALLERLEAKGERVDVIVWPENSAEFDLRSNVFGGLRVQDLARRADAPIVVGSVLKNTDGSYTNSALVWTADGEAPVRYDKRFPVPFGEYMPNRPFFRAIVPDLVDLVQLEYQPGERPPVFEVDTPHGAIRAGIAICFDIIFDDQAVQTVDDGAQVIFAQTNNADFGRTNESVQQLAIARLRAVETGRAIVNVSTVGTSAIVAPDGRDIDRLEPFKAGALVGAVPLVSGQTPAIAAGAWIAGAWLALGAAGLVAGLTASIAARRRRKGAPAETGTPSRDETAD